MKPENKLGLELNNYRADIIDMRSDTSSDIQHVDVNELTIEQVCDKTLARLNNFMDQAQTSGTIYGHTMDGISRLAVPLIAWKKSAVCNHKCSQLKNFVAEAEKLTKGSSDSSKRLVRRALIFAFEVNGVQHPTILAEDAAANRNSGYTANCGGVTEWIDTTNDMYKNITVAQACDAWFASQTGRLADSTLRGYKTAIDNWKSSSVGSKKLDEALQMSDEELFRETELISSSYVKRVMLATIKSIKRMRVSDIVSYINPNTAEGAASSGDKEKIEAGTNKIKELLTSIVDSLGEIEQIIEQFK